MDHPTFEELIKKNDRLWAEYEKAAPGGEEEEEENKDDGGADKVDAEYKNDSSDEHTEEEIYKQKFGKGRRCGDDEEQDEFVFDDFDESQDIFALNGRFVPY